MVGSTVALSLHCHSSGMDRSMHAESSYDGRVTFGERPPMLILPFCSCGCFWGADVTHGGYKLLNYCCAATLLGCMVIDPGSWQTPRGCSWRAAAEVIWAAYSRQVSELFLLGYVWLRRWSRRFIRVASLVVFVTCHSTGCAEAVIDGECE